MYACMHVYIYIYIYIYTYIYTHTYMAYFQLGSCLIGIVSIWAQF